MKVSLGIDEPYLLIGGFFLSIIAFGLGALLASNIGINEKTFLSVIGLASISLAVVYGAKSKAKGRHEYLLYFAFMPAVAVVAGVALGVTN